MARWSFSGRLLREGEEGERAGRHQVSARRTRGEREKARGRGSGADDAVASAAMEAGWIGEGWRC
jgi:hypothetical protein